MDQMDRVKGGSGQASLFYNSNPKHAKLMQTIDKLNDKYPDSIHSATNPESRHLVTVCRHTKRTTAISDDRNVKIYFCPIPL